MAILIDVSNPNGVKFNALNKAMLNDIIPFQTPME